jgi:hypothetical protein
MQFTLGKIATSTRQRLPKAGAGTEAGKNQFEYGVNKKKLLLLLY